MKALAVAAWRTPYRCIMPFRFKPIPALLILLSTVSLPGHVGAQSLTTRELNARAAAQAAAATPQAGPGYAIPVPSDPVEALSRYLRVLAASPRNLDALSGAGNAALAIGDANAAVSLFARAEAIAPRNGRIKAGLASGLVQLDQPRTAIKLFDDAVALGVPEAEIAGDRGLAYDLRGDTRRAQADYAQALRWRPDDEVTRRLAVSQAILGEKAAALATLDGLLRRQDRAAWRVRAFVLALSGDRPGAEAAAIAVMPRGQAQALIPFFGRLAALRPGQKAAAVHLGQFPSDGRTSMVEQPLFADATPPSPPRAPPQAAPTGAPTRVPVVPAAPAQTGAAASTGPAAAPGRLAGQGGASGFAPIPAATSVGVIQSAVAPALTPPPATRAGPPVATSIAASSISPPFGGGVGGGVVAVPSAALAAREAVGPLTVAARPEMAASNPLPTRAVEPSPLVVASAPQPSPQPTGPALAGLPTPDAPRSGSPLLDAAPMGDVAAGFTSDPLAAGSSVAAPGQPVQLALASAPSPSLGQAGAVIRSFDLPASIPAQAPVRDAPRVSTGQDGERPPRSISSGGNTSPPSASKADVARPDSARAGSAKAARDKGAADEKTRKAAETKAGKAKADAAAKARDADAATAERNSGDAKGKDAKGKDAKSGKAAKAKDPKDPKDPKGGKSATREAKADGKAGNAADKATSPSGERYWVQVASGSNRADLGKVWGKTRDKAPKLLAGRTTWTTPWKQSNRLLVGPFKSEEEAQGLVNSLGKAGLGGIRFTTEGKAKVEKLDSE